MKNIVRALIFSLLLSGLALFLTLRGEFDFSSFARLGQLSAPGILLVVTVLFAWWTFAGVRIIVLARGLGHRLGLLPAVRAYLLGLFSGAVTPSATGSSVAIGWYLSRYIGGQQAGAIAVFTIVLDLVFYAWSLPLSFILLGRASLGLPIQGLGVLVAVASLVFLSLAWGLTYRLSILSRLVWRIFSLRWLRRFRRAVYVGVRRIGKQLHFIAAVPWPWQLALHLSTAFMFVAHYAVLNAVAFALDLFVPQVELLALQTFIVAISFLVPTPGGAGYFEAMLALTLGQFVQKEDVLLLVLLWRFCSFYLYFLVGPLIGGMALLRANPKPTGTKQER